MSCKFRGGGGGRAEMIAVILKDLKALIKRWSFVFSLLAEFKNAYSRMIQVFSLHYLQNTLTVLQFDRLDLQHFRLLKTQRGKIYEISKVYAMFGCKEIGGDYNLNAWIANIKDTVRQQETWGHYIFNYCKKGAEKCFQSYLKALFKIYKSKLNPVKIHSTHAFQFIKLGRNANLSF